MNITKTSDKVSFLKSKKEIANVDCNICPSCKEDKSNLYYIKQGNLNKGISGGTYKSWAEGLFKMKNYKVDCYKCYTCGCEWESEKYEY